eukprot:6213983-Pleurochrysis_carterae.AAC.1
MASFSRSASTAACGGACSSASPSRWSHVVKTSSLVIETVSATEGSKDCGATKPQGSHAIARARRRVAAKFTGRQACTCS